MDKLIDLGTLCELLSITKNQGYILVNKKKIPVVRIGRQLRFRPSQIEKWLDENSQDAKLPENNTATKERRQQAKTKARKAASIDSIIARARQEVLG